MTPTAILALCAPSAALYVIAIALFVRLHRRVPEVDWLCDAVSNYGVSPAAGLFRAYSHVSTLAATLLAVQFALSSAPGIPRAAVVAMVLTPLLRVGVTLVPTDLPGVATSARGRLHLVFAIATFAASYTAIANATPVLAAAAPGWLAAILSGLYIVATLALVGVVATMLPALKRVFGLFERVFLLSTMLWFLAANAAFMLVARLP